MSLKKYNFDFSADDVPLKLNKSFKRCSNFSLMNIKGNVISRCNKICCVNLSLALFLSLCPPADWAEPDPREKRIGLGPIIFRHATAVEFLWHRTGSHMMLGPSHDETKKYTVRLFSPRLPNGRDTPITASLERVTLILMLEETPICS